MNSQNWTDPEFCESYDEMMEIATDQVHYGWLAPGERELELLLDFPLKGAHVLDIGCGRGENLIALAREGAQCYGLDISEYMLNRARENWAEEFSGNDQHSVQFSCEDMRHFHGFTGIKFDLILSIYSLEYLMSIRELRNVLSMIFGRLQEGGVFLFSFSHPLQHNMHRVLGNASARIDPGDLKSPLIYSFQDVVAALSDVGFHVERVVELSTRNPSRISYKEALRFPYHFREGHNLCTPEYDEISNRSPHTVVYRTIKPVKTTIRERRASLPGLEYEKRKLWGRNRTVRERIPLLHAGGTAYTVDRLAPSDSIVAVCDVLSFIVEKKDFVGSSFESLVLHRAGKEYRKEIRSNTALGILHRRLDTTDLLIQYELSSLQEGEDLLEGIFLERVDPLYGRLVEIFPRKRIGLLLFINESEPGSGKVGLDSFTPALGDRIDLRYIVASWAEEWPGRRTRQLELF